MFSLCFTMQLSKGEKGKTFDIFCQVKYYQSIAILAVLRPRFAMMLISSLGHCIRRKDGAMS